MGNAWNFGYPANVHSTRAEITTPAAKSVQREAVGRNEAAERDAERKVRWEQAGICFVIAVFILLTLGLGALLLISARNRSKSTIPGAVPDVHFFTTRQEQQNE